jgi:hypothetical protein
VDEEVDELALRALCPASFAVMVSVIACMAAVPAAFWLADVSLIPWAQELRWKQLRSQRSPVTSLDDHDSVEVSRGGCFGHCPVYWLKLFASGRVEFHGIENVCAPGAQRAQVSGVDARELIADITAAGFFDLHWNPGHEAADASRASITLHVGERRRTLPDQNTDMNSPRLLREIESEIKAVTAVDRWLPRRVQGYYTRDCAEPGP